LEDEVVEPVILGHFSVTWTFLVVRLMVLTAVLVRLLWVVEDRNLLLVIRTVVVSEVEIGFLRVHIKAASSTEEWFLMCRVGP
jgi:hypothetical protein